MTRDQDQFKLPKLPFIFDFSVNENWKEAYDICLNDNWFNELPVEIEEDLKTILQSIAIIFTDCSSKKLVFLTKAYMIFVHLLDSSDWDNFEDVDSKIDYLKQCFDAFQTKNDTELKNLNPYFYKLTKLFKDYENENYLENDELYSIDNLMKSLIESLNEIMINVQCEHIEQFSDDPLNVDDKINYYLSHNISNHYDVILSRLFFNKILICQNIENDRNYKELKNIVSKMIGIINDIYSLPTDYHNQSDQMNFIIKLSEWLNTTIARSIEIAPDYVDELLQRFDYLSKKLFETYQNSSKIACYLQFWKSMYIGALFFCTQTPRYAKFFKEPIKYKFLNEKFNKK